MLKLLQIWIARQRLAWIARGIDGARLERRKLIAQHEATMRDADEEISRREESAAHARRKLAELECPPAIASAFTGAVRKPVKPVPFSGSAGAAGSVEYGPGAIQHTPHYALERQLQDIADKQEGGGA